MTKFNLFLTRLIKVIKFKFYNNSKKKNVLSKLKNIKSDARTYIKLIN